MLRRSPASSSKGTSLALQIGESMIEWKYTNGLWRAAYGSPTRAVCVSSWEFSAGWRQVRLSVVELPMSSM